MREPLSRERVLSTAVALADKEGVGALTMRRLAAELGVEAMSLYYHLPGRTACSTDWSRRSWPRSPRPWTRPRRRRRAREAGAGR